MSRSVFRNHSPVFRSDVDYVVVPGNPTTVTVSSSLQRLPPGSEECQV